MPFSSNTVGMGYFGQLVVFSENMVPAKQQRDDLIQVGLEIGGSCNCVDLRPPPFPIAPPSPPPPYSDPTLVATKDSNIQPACLYCRSDLILPHNPWIVKLLRQHFCQISLLPFMLCSSWFDWNVKNYKHQQKPEKSAIIFWIKLLPYVGLIITSTC